MGVPEVRLPALHGMILAGGESRRMGRDKGLLAYRGSAHREYLYALIRPVCDVVWLSLRVGQPEPDPARYNVLFDVPAYAGNGPISAVMGFRDAHPEAALLLLSCDLPYFNRAALDALLAGRDPARPATAFLNPDNGKPEPLVTIYEPDFLARLPRRFASGMRSLQRALLEDSPALVNVMDPRWIRSVDAPDEFDAALRDLRDPGHGSNP